MPLLRPRPLLPESRPRRWPAGALLRRLARGLAVLTCTAALAPHGLAAQAQVAVAANFAEPIKSIAAVLRKSTGHELLVSVGATGKYAGAPKVAGTPFREVAIRWSAP